MRQFFKTTITFEVLSEGELGDMLSLSQIETATEEGDCVGRFGETKVEALTPKQVADACHAFASTPEFFQLDDDGNELDEE